MPETSVNVSNVSILEWINTPMSMNMTDYKKYTSSTQKYTSSKRNDPVFLGPDREKEGKKTNNTYR